MRWLICHNYVTQKVNKQVEGKIKFFFVRLGFIEKSSETRQSGKSRKVAYTYRYTSGQCWDSYFLNVTRYILHIIYN